MSIKKYDLILVADGDNCEDIIKTFFNLNWRKICLNGKVEDETIIIDPYKGIDIVYPRDKFIDTISSYLTEDCFSNTIIKCPDDLYEEFISIPDKENIGYSDDNITKVVFPYSNVTICKWDIPEIIYLQIDDDIYYYSYSENHVKVLSGFEVENRADNSMFKTNSIRIFKNSEKTLIYARVAIDENTDIRRFDNKFSYINAKLVKE